MRRVARFALVSRTVLAGVAGAAMIAVLAGPAQAARGPVAPDTVLINQPASRVCTGATFKVGVWYQKFSGGSRAYRVAVYSPRGRRVLYRHGYAPAAHWTFWKVRARLAGTYHTIYWGHWAKSGGWSRYRAATRARRC